MRKLHEEAHNAMAQYVWFDKCCISTIQLFNQAFSQRGVRVSFGHPIADFGHPNIHICVYNAMGWKGIGHPIHPKYAFWAPYSDILAKSSYPTSFLPKSMGVTTPSTAFIVSQSNLASIPGLLVYAEVKSTKYYCICLGIYAIKVTEMCFTFINNQQL